MLAMPQAISPSDALTIDEQLVVAIPNGHERGKVAVVVRDSLSRRDLGEVIFPLHKLAEKGSVQGWYFCKKPGGSKTALEIKGYFTCV